VTALSVIICAHSPRPDHLQRVLDALRSQTLAREEWELLLIDNGSRERLANQWDLSWHPSARHIREDEVGLTAARLRGISEAKGNLFVFVDDDNVLAPSYLDEALQISRGWPLLGAWGGTIKAEFEIEPEAWTQPLLINLGIREFFETIWSNDPENWRAQPCGAGMCVRGAVARAYAQCVTVDPIRRRLDRAGDSLSSCGDSDIVLTSRDFGQGFGNFPQLVLTHLIPATRVQPSYLIRLMQGITTSGVLLHYFRSGVVPPEPNPLRVWARYILTWLTQGAHCARVYKASRDAVRVGVRTARYTASKKV
jgi:glycosyltransferase involved in cell wall biosynthesis